MADRPSAEVTITLNRLLRQLPKSYNAAVVAAPFPLVTDRERFMEALRTHHTTMRSMCETPPQAVSIWDDDMWLSEDGIRELSGHLVEFDCDRIEARSHFLWDQLGAANKRFPEHWQTLVFRHYPDDEFTDELMVQCTRGVADSRHAVRMDHHLHNAGYLTQDDREKCWQMYRACGKIDSHTLTLVQPPRLVMLDQQPA